MDGTPIDIEKMRSISVLGKRSKPRVVEGKAHPDSGLRYKATTDEAGATVTEHSNPRAPGVSARQDVHIRPGFVDGNVQIQGAS